MVNKLRANYYLKTRVFYCLTLVSTLIVLKSEQKWHICALNHRKKKRTFKSHRQKFIINS